MRRNDRARGRRAEVSPRACFDAQRTTHDTRFRNALDAPHVAGLVAYELVASAGIRILDRTADEHALGLVRDDLERLGRATLVGQLRQVHALAAEPDRLQIGPL